MIMFVYCSIKSTSVTVHPATSIGPNGLPMFLPPATKGTKGMLSAISSWLKPNCIISRETSSLGTDCELSKSHKRKRAQYRSLLMEDE